MENFVNMVFLNYLGSSKTFVVNFSFFLSLPLSLFSNEATCRWAELFELRLRAYGSSSTTAGYARSLARGW